mmetsp:Transcript_56217/g.131663  ORF Transcript_56217/g.131663 Transcript_56217/m.131663 type:complete len:220 (+) Transcript_56217:75-734(+)
MPARHQSANLPTIRDSASASRLRHNHVRASRRARGLQALPKLTGQVQTTLGPDDTDIELLLMDRSGIPDKAFFEQAKVELARHAKELQAVEGELCARSGDLDACSQHLEACASTWRRCDDSLVARVEQLNIFRRRADELKQLQDDANKAISQAVRNTSQNWHHSGAPTLPRSASALKASMAMRETVSGRKFFRPTSSAADPWTPQKCLNRRSGFYDTFS